MNREDKIYWGFIALFNLAIIYVTYMLIRDIQRNGILQSLLNVSAGYPVLLFLLIIIDVGIIRYAIVSIRKRGKR